MIRRNFLAVLGLTIASTKVIAKSSDTAATNNKGKTYVLLHGAWHGGWCWRDVAQILQNEGHQVYTPTQTGLGERSHLLSDEINLETFVTDLVNVLEWEDLTDVILVGHSFGGIGISGAADRVPHRIKHLVYLDALLLEDRDSPFSQIPADVADARRKLAQEFSGGVSMPVPSAEAFGVYDAKQVQWLKEKCTPHPISTYEDALTLNNPLGNGLPATYIAVTPHYGPTQASRELVQKKKDWDYIEIEAGHDAMVTSPQAVADILLKI